MGRLQLRKGGDVLLRAWAKLPSLYRDTAQLVFVGDGDERTSLGDLAVSLGLEEGVTFVGSQENVCDWYQASDVFILPSRSEGLSNALVEAMACGLPVICSAVGGALDLVQPGETGELFVSENDADLARVMIKVLESSDLWTEMGCAARKVVEERVSLISQVKRLSDLYRVLQQD